MSRSNKFPDVREFRSRLRTMGFSTGAEEPSQPTKPAKKPKKSRQYAATSVLWSSLGVGGIAILGWLAVDMGGPKQMMTALVSVGDGSQRYAYANRRNSGFPDGSGARFSASDGQDVGNQEEVLALQRRVAMLEGMLTGTPGSAVVAQGQSNFGPPRTTASTNSGAQSNDITFQFAPLVEKSDLPMKSSDRAPTAPVDRPMVIGRQFTTGTKTRPMTTGAAPEAATRSRFATQTGYGLDLGAYSSLQQLRLGWYQLARRNPDILSDLAPRHLTEFSADGRVAYRLIAAPLSDAMDVAKRCASLKARSITCKQTQGTGEPLL